MKMSEKLREIHPGQLPIAAYGVATLRVGLQTDKQKRPEEGRLFKPICEAGTPLRSLCKVKKPHYNPHKGTAAPTPA